MRTHLAPGSEVTFAVPRLEGPVAHGITHTPHATGDHDQAHHHWHQALYTDLDILDADQVHALKGRQPAGCQGQGSRVSAGA